jgi:hypothetical protein
MQIESAQFPIEHLLSWIRTGRLAIPDFQREFLWEPDQVVELLDSIARLWPIGSLLLLVDSDRKLGSRPVACAPRESSDWADVYVLDGQQRITAIYHAFADVSDKVYFVDFKSLESGESEFIRWEHRSAFDLKYPTLRSQSERSVCTIRTVWEEDTFRQWLDLLPNTKDIEEFGRLRRERTAGLTPKLYQLVAVQLGAGISLHALARIFESLNRTGTALDAFDLAVAILYPSGFNLKKAWHESKGLYDSFHSFEVDPLEVLKLSALLIRAEFGKQAAPGVRQGDLLSINPKYLIETWSAAAELYDRALTFGKTRLGWFVRDVVPNQAIVLGLAMGISSNLPLSALTSWYWGSAFTQAFSQAANTRIVADTDAMASGSGGEIGLARMKSISVFMKEPARKNGSALRALAGFLAAKLALDPVSGKYLKDLGSVSFRAIENDSRLVRLGERHGFDQLVVLGKSSDRSLRTGAEFDSHKFREALVSQLIDLKTGRRDLLELESQIRAQTYGDW